MVSEKEEKGSICIKVGDMCPSITDVMAIVPWLTDHCPVSMAHFGDSVAQETLW